MIFVRRLWFTKSGTYALWTYTWVAALARMRLKLHHHVVHGIKHLGHFVLPLLTSFGKGSMWGCRWVLSFARWEDVCGPLGWPPRRPNGDRLICVCFSIQLAKDLLRPSPEEEKRKHKLKRLVQSPNSFFMDVKCPGRSWGVENK